jgi:hypothetical protein
MAGGGATVLSDEPRRKRLKIKTFVTPPPIISPPESESKLKKPKRITNRPDRGPQRRCDFFALVSFFLLSVTISFLLPFVLFIFG